MSVDDKSRLRAEDAEDNRYWAALAYFGILFLIPLLLRPGSRFAKYHGQQGMMLFLVAIVFSFMVKIPLVGWLIIAPVGGLYIVICFVIGIANALAGHRSRLPIIGRYAEKI